MLTFSGWQWAATYTALRLPDLALTFPKSYLIGRPAVYGLLSLAIAIGLYFGFVWAPRWARWVGLGIVIWSTLERLIFSPSQYASRTLIGTSLITFLLWGILLLILRRPKVRDYFQENPA